MTDKTFYVPGLMDLSGYHLEKADGDPNWNDRVAQSPQGTIFSDTRFLTPLKCKPALWYCLKKDQFKAAVALTESVDGKSAEQHRLVIYAGIMFSPNDPAQSSAQVLSEQFRISAFIVEELGRIYQRVKITFHPAFQDIRPFLWYHYGRDDLPQYQVDVRYTSVIPLGPGERSDLEKQPVYALANKSRRQEIRYGLNKGVVTEELDSPNMLIEFYRRTLERQEIEVPPENLEELEALISSLHQEELCRTYLSYTPQGEPASLATFGIDSKRAYYLFGASDPRTRNSHAGTTVLWDSFCALGNHGIAEADLEGVNSPARGYFKLSLGGALVPYYRLELTSPVT